MGFNRMTENASRETGQLANMFMDINVCKNSCVDVGPAIDEYVIYMVGSNIYGTIIIKYD